MKYLQKVGSILIIGGAILAVYQLITGDENTTFTKSTGFYIFILGLLIVGIVQLLNQQKKKS